MHLSFKLIFLGMEYKDQDVEATPHAVYILTSTFVTTIGSEIDVGEGKLDLGPLYKQKRKARLTSQTVQVTTIQKLGDHVIYRTAEFENDDPVVADTLLGTRMNKGPKQVNNCIVSSFETSNLG